MHLKRCLSCLTKTKGFFSIKVFNPFKKGVYPLEIILKIKDETQYILNQYKYYKNPKKIVTNWIIEQFKEGKKYYIDPLLPYESQDNIQLIINIVQDRIIKKERIDDFIKDLDFTNKFTKAVDKIRQFIQSKFYQQNFNNCSCI